MSFSSALFVGLLIIGAYFGTQYVQYSFKTSKMRGAIAPNADTELPPWYRPFAPLCAAFDGLGKLFAVLFGARSQTIEKYLKALALTNRMRVSNIWTLSVVLMVIYGGLFSMVGFFLDSAAGKEEGILWLFGLVPGCLAGLNAPVSRLKKAVEARKRQMSRELPFVFDLLNAAVGSGQSFGAAVKSYLELGLPGPLAEEFALMDKEQQMSSREVALRNMAARVELNDFTYFAEAVINSDKTGATLGETIRVQAEEMRKARFNLAERLAAKAPTKILFPMILFIMPSVFIIIGTAVLIRILDAIRGIN